jgi:hypothetical protein
MMLMVIICCSFPFEVHSAVSEGWEKHVIADQSSPIHLYVKDMDGDNDFDRASATNRICQFLCTPAGHTEQGPAEDS